MPHEILSRSYLADSLKGRRTEEEIEAIDLQQEHSNRNRSLPGTPCDVEPTHQYVVHNFQHDLESLWWIILWTLTHRTKYAEARQYAKKIFQNTIILSDARSQAFRHSIRNNLKVCLAPELHAFVDIMEILRAAMWNKSMDRGEQDLHFDVNSYAFVHIQFQTRFEQLLSRQASWRNYSLRVLNPETAGKTENQRAPTRIKRQRSEDSYKPTASDNEASESDSNTSELSYKRVKV